MTMPTPPGEPRFQVPVCDRVTALVAALSDISDFTPLPEYDTFVITVNPAIIYKNGQAVGYEVWVQHFDAEGYELDIDPHRVFINPPDGSYIDQYGVRQQDASVADVVCDTLANTVRVTPGR